MSKAASTAPSEIHDVIVTVHHKPACRVELEVHTPPLLVAKARKDAIKKVNKEITFPGFRKGKAPDDVVLKKYPSAVEQQWHKSIADAAFTSAQAQVRVPVLNSGAPVTFDLKKHSLEEGADLLFSFETEPKIPSVDPKQFYPKPVEKQEIDDKRIDEAIRQMRFFFAQWTPVEERGIQEGDYIQIDLDTLEGDEPEKVFDHIRFEVSSERMANWMKNLVLGAKAGAVLEGESVADDTLSEEEKKEFTPKKVRLTIHRVEEATLPELDDEFAKKVGVEDIADLREQVKSILQRNVDDQADSKLREQVNDFLTQNYTFEMPLSLIDTERKHRKQQFLSDPKAAETYELLSEEEKQKLDERIYNESSEAVRLFYLSRHVVREAKLPVTHEEVQEEAVKTASSFGQRIAPDQLPKEAFALALSKVILAKAQNYILEHCNKENA